LSRRAFEVFFFGTAMGTAQCSGAERPAAKRRRGAPGSWPWPGEHPWNRGDDTRWRGHGVLTLHRTGSAHSLWVFWFGEEREFRGWYANLAEPIRRTKRGFDTLDHELDVWIHPDGTWELKDEELLEPWVERGRWSAAEVAEIRAEGARVVADAEAGRQWRSDQWAGWEPDPSWTGLELPAGWNDDDDDDD
jgi:Protein of unknown function (DUF402)